VRKVLLDQYNQSTNAIDDMDFLKSPSLLISGSAENIKKVSRLRFASRKFLSSTYVLVGKSIDDIVHGYFVQEARRSLYSFKT